MTKHQMKQLRDTLDLVIIDIKTHLGMDVGMIVVAEFSTLGKPDWVGKYKTGLTWAEAVALMEEVKHELLHQVKKAPCR